MVAPLDGPLRRAILLRHGQTAWNLEKRWQGRTDIALDATGLAQAERAAEVLVRDASIVSLTYSPLRRAAQTAAVLKGAFDLRGRPLRRRSDERLVEIDTGQWSTMLHSEVHDAYPEESAALARGEDIPRGVHGESMADVAARVRPAFDEATAPLAAGESALLVLHGAAMRALAADAVGLTHGQVAHTFTAIGNCGWIVLVGDDSGSWRVEQWNAGAGAAAP